MSLDDQALEERLQELGLDAPRVTPEKLKSVIQDVYFFTAMDGYVGVGGTRDPEDGAPKSLNALELLTFCVLVLKNGFTVHGTSACASPENFNAAVGREIAYKNALNEIWPLEGYLLKQQLHEEAQ